MDSYLITGTTNLPQPCDSEKATKFVDRAICALGDKIYNITGNDFIKCTPHYMHVIPPNPVQYVFTGTEIDKLYSMLDPQ
jgi:hypothetical protein